MIMLVWLWNALNISSYGYPGLKKSLNRLRRTWNGRLKKKGKTNMSKAIIHSTTNSTTVSLFTKGIGLPCEIFFKEKRHEKTVLIAEMC